MNKMQDPFPTVSFRVAIGKNIMAEASTTRVGPRWERLTAGPHRIHHTENIVVTLLLLGSMLALSQGVGLELGLGGSGGGMRRPCVSE